MTRLRRKMPGVQRTTLLIQKVLARSRGRWTFCSRSPFIAFEARTARWPRFNSVQPLLTERPCRANLATPSIQRADFSRSKYARRAASFGMPSTPRNCLRAVGRKAFFSQLATNIRGSVSRVYWDFRRLRKGGRDPTLGGQTRERACAYKVGCVRATALDVLELNVTRRDQGN